MNVPDLAGLTLSAGDVLVVQSRNRLTTQQMETLHETLDKGIASTGVKVLVLDYGLEIVGVDSKRMARMEEKLDTLITALAEGAEEEEERPLLTLDGDAAGGERDQGQSLG